MAAGGGNALCYEAVKATGATTSKSSQTARRGVLNPLLSLWLMGYPKEWFRAYLSSRGYLDEWLRSEAQETQ